MNKVLRTAQLGDLATITMGQSPDSAAVNGAEVGLPFLQGCAEFGARFPQPRFHCSPPLRVAKSGSILISVRAPVGTTNRADQDYCIGRGLGAVLAKPGVADKVFLLHAIDANLEFLHRRSQGSTFLAIGSKELSSLPVPAPEFAVQRRIAEILSTLDEAIEQTEALIAKHQQIKAGLMHDLFTRGVTPDGHLRPTREQAPDLYKESPLGWIPKEWEVVTTEEKVDVIDPQPDHRTPPEMLDGYPYVGIGDVMPSGELDFTHARKVAAEAYRRQLQSFEIHPGAFIFGKIGTLGQPTRIPHERCFAVSANVVLLTTSIKNDADFVFWIYSSPFIDGQVADATNTTSQPALGIQRIRKFHIPWPTRLEERSDIALRLKSITETIQADERTREKLRQQKHGLMHDLLTGRVRVKAERYDYPGKAEVER